eukprot:GFUD01000465.1.p1 GENE.GFUD01000465.1~~GFUD01000465.1.p1  ORF type:complete len:276 (+),score=76.99 GFUD01000465.1:129-956(+)
MPSTHIRYRIPKIYSSNREVASAGYSSSSSAESSSRSARATSVAAGSESASSRVVRAATVAPSAGGQSLSGYSGYYGRQMALLNEKSASAVTAAKYDAAFTSHSSAARAVAMSMSSSKTTSVQEKTTTSTSVQSTLKTSAKFDAAKEQKSSLEYGKSSKSSALRRAEIHAQNSGKDPRHVPVPRNVDDDICKMVADIHLTDRASVMSREGRTKVDRMQKELSALTSSAMSYKSIYAKSASQMAKEAMEACASEATSSKKVRKTVVETSSKRVAAA